MSKNTGNHVAPDGDSSQTTFHRMQRDATTAAAADDDDDVEGLSDIYDSDESDNNYDDSSQSTFHRIQQQSRATSTATTTTTGTSAASAVNVNTDDSKTDSDDDLYNLSDPGISKRSIAPTPQNHATQSVARRPGFKAPQPLRKRSAAAPSVLFFWKR